MGTLVQGILDNDSFFGKLMTKAGIIIGANFMFLIFSLPVITIGPAIAALYYVMLETLHGEGVLNPFKEFWKGFRMNFRQGTISWLIFLGIMLLGIVDIQICNAAGGIFNSFRYGLYAIGILIIITFMYLMPVMAAFSDSLPHLVRNAWFFVCKKPIALPVILFFDVFPIYLTYSDPQYLPLYAFLWCMFGFGGIAMIGAALLYPEFKKFLTLPDEEEIMVEEYDEDEEKMLEELRKMDGL